MYKLIYIFLIDAINRQVSPPFLGYVENVDAWVQYFCIWIRNGAVVKFRQGISFDDACDVNLITVFLAYIKTLHLDTTLGLSWV